MGDMHLEMLIDTFIDKSRGIAETLFAPTELIALKIYLHKSHFDGAVSIDKRAGIDVYQWGHG